MLIQDQEVVVVADKNRENTEKQIADAGKIYTKRLEKHHDELRWLYMELYDNGSMFAELTERLEASTGSGAGN